MTENTPRPRVGIELTGRLWIEGFVPTMQTAVGMGGVFTLSALNPLQEILNKQVGWLQTSVIVIAVVVGFALAVLAGRIGQPWLPTAFAAIASAVRWGVEDHPAEAVALISIVVVTLLARWVIGSQSSVDPTATDNE